MRARVRTPGGIKKQDKAESNAADPAPNPPGIQSLDGQTRGRKALDFLRAFEPSIRKLAADVQARGEFTRWLSCAIEDLDEAPREVSP